MGARTTAAARIFCGKLHVWRLLCPTALAMAIAGASAAAPAAGAAESDAESPLYQRTLDWALSNFRLTDLDLTRPAESSDGQSIQTAREWDRGKQMQREVTGPVRRHPGSQTETPTVFPILPVPHAANSHHAANGSSAGKNWELTLLPFRTMCNPTWMCENTVCASNPTICYPAPTVCPGCPPSGPDLKGDVADVSPRPVVAGRAVRVAGNVSNVGNEPTSGPFRIEFWLWDVDWITEYRFCDPILIQDAMGVDESIDLAAHFPRMCNARVQAGTYSLQMRIDPASAIDDANTANNNPSLSNVTVVDGRPDLAIVDFDFRPRDVRSDGESTIAFTGNVTNNSVQATTQSFWIEFRVSSDPQSDPVGSYLCPPLLIAQGIQPGESVPLSDYSRKTYTLDQGSYRVGIAIDPQNRIAEQREDNNLFWTEDKTLRVGIGPSQAARWPLYP